MRRTKVVATIGPASAAPPVLSQLLAAGVDVVRLNYSHGTAADHAAVIARVREGATALGRSVAVMQDLAGPKIRTGPLAAESVELVEGAEFTLTARPVPGDARTVSITWPTLPRDVQPGDRLLLADGALELAVVGTTATDITCRVVTGGRLGPHKGINAPGRAISASCLTDKDRADLASGLAQGVDLVALSFVRGPEDLREARRLVREAGADTPLVAKIERPEALAAIDEILAAADALLIARGDLGVEIPVEQVPGVQKLLIEKANRAGKPVITATQMLRSMVDSPRPTRAEVTDVANAILDGTDAVMLSEETAVGVDPLAAVTMMERIAVEAERHFPYRTWSYRFDRRAMESDAEAVAHAACEMAQRIGAAAILTLTRSGATTRLVAKFRPPQPVLALTPEAATGRRLAMTWGAAPLHVPTALDADAMEREAIAKAVAGGWLRPGQKAVVTAGTPLHGPGSTNLIKIVTAPAR